MLLKNKNEDRVGGNWGTDGNEGGTKPNILNRALRATCHICKRDLKGKQLLTHRPLKQEHAKNRGRIPQELMKNWCVPGTAKFQWATWNSRETEEVASCWVEVRGGYTEELETDHVMQGLLGGCRDFGFFTVKHAAIISFEQQGTVI